MANIYKSLTELIGGTPLLEVTNYEKKHKLNAKILAKLEYFNPAGSVKDRVAKAMIEDAEAKGQLKEGSVIIEPTSGNTGIGLAAVGTARGYRVILTMPETMSIERRNLVKAYGAEVVLTEGAKGMKGAIAKAEELAMEIPNSFIPGQFVNPANPAVHQATTGPEIWNDTDGNVDVFEAERFQAEGQVFIVDLPLLRQMEKLPFSAALAASVIMAVFLFPARIFFFRVPDDLRVWSYQKVISPPLQFFSAGRIQHFIIFPSICYPHFIGFLSLLSQNLSCSELYVPMIP